MGMKPVDPEERDLESPGKTSTTFSVVNFVLYMLCVSSLGASIYSNLRLATFDDRLRQLRHLDDRISALESQCAVDKSSSDGGFAQSVEPKVFYNIINDDSVTRSFKGDSDGAIAPSSQDLLRQLTAQVAGIHRLRRDVSQLQVSRKERQSGSPDCICPPGLTR